MGVVGNKLSGIGIIRESSGCDLMCIYIGVIMIISESL